MPKVPCTLHNPRTQPIKNNYYNTFFPLVLSSVLSDAGFDSKSLIAVIAVTQDQKVKDQLRKKKTVRGKNRHLHTIPLILVFTFCIECL